jgi:DNA-binding response OmpR family regulator
MLSEMAKSGVAGELAEGAMPGEGAQPLTASQARILVVEDDRDIAGLVGRELRALGHTVDMIGLAEDALDAARATDYALMIVDLGLPDRDGLDLVREMRRRSIAAPILMLTARRKVEDRVSGLASGADDYLVKPFDLDELLARVRAVLRRAAPEALSDRLRVGDLEIDVSARRVTVSGREVELTALELDLLLALARRAGRVVPRDALFPAAGRGDTAVSERTVDVHISHLRGKLGDDPRAQKRIRTVRGVGYVLVKDGT